MGDPPPRCRATTTGGVARGCARLSRRGDATPKSASGDGDAVAAAFGDVPRTFSPRRDPRRQRRHRGYLGARRSLELPLRSGDRGAEHRARRPPARNEGGKVTIKVALLLHGADVHDGIITIVCLLGEPPKNAVESTLLPVEGTNLTFNEPVSGDIAIVREPSDTPAAPE